MQKTRQLFSKSSALLAFVALSVSACVAYVPPPPPPPPVAYAPPPGAYYAPCCYAYPQYPPYGYPAPDVGVGFSFGGGRHWR